MLVSKPLDSCQLEFNFKHHQILIKRREKVKKHRLVTFAIVVQARIVKAKD